MFTKFTAWWNEPTENLQTQGENIVSFFFIIVLPGISLLLLCFKVFGAMAISGWWVSAPLLGIVLLPFVKMFMKTGRSILLKGTNLHELTPDEALTVRARDKAAELAHKESIVVGVVQAQVFEDKEDTTALYVIYKEVTKDGLGTGTFSVELNKKSLVVVRSQFVKM